MSVKIRERVKTSESLETNGTNVARSETLST